MTVRSILSRVLIGALALLGAHSAVIAADSNDAFVIGGWDDIRGGELSIESGDLFEEARESLALNFPNATYASVGELSADSLAGIDMLILTSGAENDTPITPLTAAEQNALVAFVEGGGGALLLADNDSFGGTPNDPNPPPDATTILVNNSLISPFGLTAGGTFIGFPIADVTDQTSPVTSVPFGVVDEIATVYPGRLETLGDATSLADTFYDNGVRFGDLLAEIPQGRLGTDSGAVVITSDFSMFVDGGDEGDDGKFSDVTGRTEGNERLFLNIISAICRVPGTGGEDPPGNEPIEVEIDILPRQRTNGLGLRSHRGKLPVVVFSADGFDPCDIDPATLELAGASVASHPRKDKLMARKTGDRNHDGVKDLLVLFEVKGLDPDQIVDKVATLTGETFDGDEIEGSDELILFLPKHCPRFFDYYWPLHWHGFWKDHFPHEWKKKSKDHKRDWSDHWHSWK